MDSLSRSIIIQDGRRQECDSWAASEIIRLREEVSRLRAEAKDNEETIKFQADRHTRMFADFQQAGLDRGIAEGKLAAQKIETSALRAEVARLTALYNDTKADLKLQEDANSGLWRVNEQRRRDNAELRASEAARGALAGEGRSNE